MANTVEKVIKIAEAEVGYLEKSASAYKKNPSCLDSKVTGAGSDNYTKYGRDMHKIYPTVMDFPAAWCDCFVDWCFYQAYGTATAKSLLAGDFNDYTVASAQMYKNKKAWYTKNPKIGDQIFFLDSKGGICHTGLVYKVDSSHVYTIEGNTSSASGVVANGGGVAKKVYSLTYSRIAGYGRPKYDSSTSSSSTTEKTSTKSTTSSVPKLASANPVLKKGSKGDEVTLLQKDLNYVNNAKLEVDGSFGSATETALKKFQKAQKLTQDGEYGTKTQAALKKLLK
jgi:hypothetical protein